MLTPNHPSAYARINEAQRAPFSRLKLGPLFYHLPELVLLALGLLLTLALMPASSEEQSAYALKPLADLMAYLVGAAGAPTKDELLAELDTKVALTQMALCAAIGIAAGGILAYGRALRALWQHRTMTMLDELLGSKLLARTGAQLSGTELSLNPPIRLYLGLQRHLPHHRQVPHLSVPNFRLGSYLQVSVYSA